MKTRVLFGPCDIMAIQNKVALAKRFVEFEKLCEALDQYECDADEFLNWLEPKLLEFLGEQIMGRGRQKITKVDLPADRTAQLTRWRELTAQLETIQNEEKQLRTALVTSSFDGTKTEGAETIDIGWGWKLRATKVINYSATNESSQTEQLLNAVGAIDPGIASGLVKWKPELSTPVYRNLLELAKTHPELNPLIAAATTIKPGMPQLEMIPPKPETAPIEIQTGFVPSAEGQTFTDGSDIKF